MTTQPVPLGEDVYDSTTIAFHWITAVLVVLMFVLALFPGSVKGAILLHKNIGIVILAVVVLRIVWRLFLGRRTRTSAAEPLFLRLGAKAAHLAVYALLIIVPLLGWLYQDAKAIDVNILGVAELPMLVYYDREFAMWIYGWKKVAAYTLLALLFAHAAAALIYHARIRKDGVLRSMLPRRLRSSLMVGALALLGAAPGAALAQTPFDVNKYAADFAASLAKACPMASPDDVAAHDACRKNIGKGAEAGMRDYTFLFGGQQPAKFWLKDKKTSVFRGDLFQDLYMSLYMFTGTYRVQDAPDGLKTIAVQAYFRNGLPAGRYPYPFWHNETKWEAYEKSNELRFRMAKDGKVIFAYRADTGSEDKRGAYAPVKHAPFVGAWMWPDDKGGAQPVVTLFSEYYSPDNPNLAALDAAYRKMALNFRNADCTVCHQPEGHWKMNKLTLLQTPLHAATSIDAVLDEVRTGKMPVDDYDDPKPLDPALKRDLLANGEAFKRALDTADAWERTNGRPKARKAAAN